MKGFGLVGGVLVFGGLFLLGGCRGDEELVGDSGKDNVASGGSMSEEWVGVFGGADLLRRTSVPLLTLKGELYQTLETGGFSFVCLPDGENAVVAYMPYESGVSDGGEAHPQIVVKSLSLHTGKVQWEQVFEGCDRFDSMVRVGDLGLVVTVGTYESQDVALIREGELVWRKRIDSATGGVLGVSWGADTVFVTKYDEQWELTGMMALEPETGEFRYEIDGAKFPSSGPGDVSVAGSLSGDVIAFRTSDGQELWRKEVAGEPNTFIHDGKVLAFDKSQTFMALSLESGEVEWNQSFSGKFNALTTYEERVYLAFEDRLVCFNLDSRKELWQVEGEFLPVVASVDGSVLVMTYGQGGLVLFDGEGQEKWRQEIEGTLTHPVMGRNGLISVMTFEGGLYVFR